jgi:signal transduction histidine kinase
MGVLVLLALSLLGSVWAGTGYAQDTTQSAKIAEGYVRDKASKQLYQYRIYADSTIYIQKGVSASSDSLIEMSAAVLDLVYRRAKRNVISSDWTDELVSVGYEDSNLTLKFTQQFNLYVLLALIVVIVVGGGLLAWLWWRLSRERRRREMIARSRRYLSEGREKERERLAQEIHDGPVQDLHGLHMQLKALAGPSDGSGAETVADEVMRVTSELRAMSADLHPPALDKFGLPAALRSHADRLQDRRGDLEVEMDLDEIDDPLPDDLALAFFRVAQEAMNNAVQHGGAQTLRVQLRRADDTVVLTVRDDGAGFTPPDDWHTLADEGHYGLLGMRERAETIGAAIEIDSTPGEGTRVQLRGAVTAAPPADDHPDPAPARVA